MNVESKTREKPKWMSFFELFLEGKTFAEIAKRHGVPPVKVYKTLSRIPQFYEAKQIITHERRVKRIR